MAFGGVAVNLAAGAAPTQTTAQGPHGVVGVVPAQYMIDVATGVTLTAFVAGPPAVRANADTGAFTTNVGTVDPVPPNTLSLPATFGPGPDQWQQADVDALGVTVQNNTVLATKLIATKAFVPTTGTPGFGNCEVIVQSMLATAATVLEIRMELPHSSIR